MLLFGAKKVNVQDQHTVRWEVSCLKLPPFGIKQEYLANKEMFKASND
jgi:hypothetical protein